jgi:hypothetical protein
MSAPSLVSRLLIPLFRPDTIRDPAIAEKERNNVRMTRAAVLPGLLFKFKIERFM